MPFIGASALAIATMRPGTRGAVGGRKPSSTPSGITRTRSAATPKSATMSRLDDAEGVSTSRAARATLTCIRRKPYQRRSERRLRQVGAAARSMRRSTVIGWWMVVTTGRPSLRHVEDPVGQHLVVVHDVEVGRAPAQQPGHPGAERLGLREAGRAHGEELLDVDEVAELPEPGHAERVGLAVEVQARHLGQPDAVVEVGVGLTGEHLDVVAERAPARG